MINTFSSYSADSSSRVKLMKGSIPARESAGGSLVFVGSAVSKLFKAQRFGHVRVPVEFITGSEI